MTETEIEPLAMTGTPTSNVVPTVMEAPNVCEKEDFSVTLFVTTNLADCAAPDLLSIVFLLEAFHSSVTRLC